MNHYGFGGESATWADYDGDADSDLFIGNYECGALWCNDGNDTFTEVLASTGIDMSDPTMPAPNNPGACIENPAGPTYLDGAKPENFILFDYDGDGWLDVFTTGRVEESGRRYVRQRHRAGGRFLQ